LCLLFRSLAWVFAEKPVLGRPLGVQGRARFGKGVGYTLWHGHYLHLRQVAEANLKNRTVSDGAGNRRAFVDARLKEYSESLRGVGTPALRGGKHNGPKFRAFLHLP